MFELRKESESGREYVLEVTLPEGKTAGELLDIAREDLRKLQLPGGSVVQISGRMTVALAALLGAYFKNAVGALQFYVPAEGRWLDVLSTSGGPTIRVGDKVEVEFSGVRLSATIISEGRGNRYQVETPDKVRLWVSGQQIRQGGRKL